MSAEADKTGQEERDWLIRMGLTVGLILGFFLGASVVIWFWVWFSLRAVPA